MNILFIGDVIGQPGRTAVAKKLPDLRQQYEADLVIANGENLAHGKGSTKKTLDELISAGVDLVTSGNHWADQREMLSVAADPVVPFVRPANYPPETPGQGYKIIQIRTQKVLVINLMGRVFMRQFFSDPFRELDIILKETAPENPNVIIVDFHADATGEAVAFGHYADGRVTAVLGTHTHIPTADAMILPKGTGYVTDVGMVGPRDSVLGMDKEEIIKHHLTQLPFKAEIATSPKIDLNFAVVRTEGLKCSSIERKTEVVEID